MSHLSEYLCCKAQWPRLASNTKLLSNKSCAVTTWQKGQPLKHNAMTINQHIYYAFITCFVLFFCSYIELCCHGETWKPDPEFSFPPHALRSLYCTCSMRYFKVFLGCTSTSEVTLKLALDYIPQNELCRALGLVFQACGSCRSNDGGICHSK